MAPATKSESSRAWRDRASRPRAISDSDATTRAAMSHQTTASARSQAASARWANAALEGSGDMDHRAKHPHRASSSRPSTSSRMGADRAWISARAATVRPSIRGGPAVACITILVVSPACRRPARAPRPAIMLRAPTAAQARNRPGIDEAQELAKGVNRIQDSPAVTALTIWTSGANSSLSASYFGHALPEVSLGCFADHQSSQSSKSIIAPDILAAPSRWAAVVYRAGTGRRRVSPAAPGVDHDPSGPRAAGRNAARPGLGRRRAQPVRLPGRTVGPKRTGRRRRGDHPLQRTRDHAGDRRANDPGDPAVRLVVSGLQHRRTLSARLRLFRPHRAGDLVDPHPDRHLPGGPHLGGLAQARSR